MFQKCESGIRNQLPVPLLLYWGLYYVLKVRIWNKEPVAGSFITVLGFVLAWGFVYFQLIRHVMTRKS